MPAQYTPFEFTPEINEAYRQSLRKPIQEQGDVNAAKAKGEALRRGMAGDPYEAVRVGQAEAATGNQLSNLDASLAYTGAGLQREERLTGEGRQYQSAEAEKSRDFQAKQAELNRSYQTMMQEAQLGAERAAARKAKGWAGDFSPLVDVASYGAGAYLGTELGG